MVFPRNSTHIFFTCSKLFFQDARSQTKQNDMSIKSDFCKLFCFRSTSCCEIVTRLWLGTRAQRTWGMVQMLRPKQVPDVNSTYSFDSCRFQTPMPCDVHCRSLDMLMVLKCGSNIVADLRAMMHLPDQNDRSPVIGVRSRFIYLYSFTLVMRLMAVSVPSSVCRWWDAWSQALSMGTDELIPQVSCAMACWWACWWEAMIDIKMYFVLLLSSSPLLKIWWNELYFCHKCRHLEILKNKLYIFNDQVLGG